MCLLEAALDAASGCIENELPSLEQAELAMAEDFDQIRSAMEKVPPYSAIFTKVCSHMAGKPICGSVVILSALASSRTGKFCWTDALQVTPFEA